MKYFSGSGLLMTTVVLLTILVSVKVMASDLEVEKTLSERISTIENNDSSLQPHRRSKRTIGHIFDMFKNMMDGLFGGGKKKKPRRPKRPGQAYGPPKPRPQNPRPSYGRPRPPPPPRPPVAPPPPRTPSLSGGYAGGNRPQAPPQPNPDSYGSPVAPPVPPRAPPAPNPDSYGSPVAPPVRAPPVPNQDSYGSPVAPPVPPRAPPAPAPDSYGSPVAPPVPQAPRAPAPDTYGSPVAPPQAPPSGYSAQPQAPRTPTGGSFGPSSVFYMIPAPNLATEGPGGRGAGGDSYGSPQAAPVSAPDSYGGPQEAPAAPDSYSGPDSYGAPVVPDTDIIVGGRTPVAVPTISNPDNPFLIQSQYNNAAPLPVITEGPVPDLNGEFVDQDGYGAPDEGVAPAPITDIDTPEEPSVIETKDTEDSVPDLPVEEIADIADIGGRAEELGSSEDTVPDLEPDPRDEEIVAPVEDTEAPETDADYDPNDDAEYNVDLRTNSLDEEAPAAIQDIEAPEGEINDLEIDDTEGEVSPLFDNLRDVAFTSADAPTTPAIDQEPIQIDLSEGVADFTNGLDDSSGPSEIDLTDDASIEYDYSQDLQAGYEDTTPVPDISYDTEYTDTDTEYEVPEDDYIGNEDIPPEFPEDLAEQVQIRAENDLSDEEYNESFGQPASSDLSQGKKSFKHFLLRKK